MSKVISAKYLPSKLPVVGTIAWGLLLKEWHVSQWVWGVFATLAIIVWIAVSIAWWQDEQVHPSKFTEKP